VNCLSSTRTELLGAIRLPNDAFKKNAGTEVTTDIVMLRKLRAVKRPPARLGKRRRATPTTSAKRSRINEYFAARPEMMLGQMRLGGGCIATTSRRLNRTAATCATLSAQAVERLPQNIYQAHAQQVAEPTLDQTIPAPDFVKPNAYCLHDGMVCIREETVLRPLTDMPSETRSRIRI
jgi:hypothetical protein